MAQVHSFPPIVAPGARILILGSMPGEASLRAGQYYAHPRNLFWRILSDILKYPLSDLPYLERITILHQHAIAVWDVLQSCERTGSLDSAIDPATIKANDFAEFFSSQPMIAKVVFNGGFAESAFRRHVRVQISNLDLQFERLPSTSPAHAALDFSSKLACWQNGLTAFIHAK